MAAFKAANPACQLADFVRWHSPKDWQPDSSHPQGGHISDRMSHTVRLTYRATDHILVDHMLTLHSIGGRALLLFFSLQISADLVTPRKRCKSDVYAVADHLAWDFIHQGHLFGTLQGFEPVCPCPHTGYTGGTTWAG